MKKEYRICRICKGLISRDSYWVKLNTKRNIYFCSQDHSKDFALRQAHRYYDKYSNDCQVGAIDRMCDNFAKWYMGEYIKHYPFMK